jgi:ABC-type branched-subunit amino acid transport system substrate-binding protein
LSREPTATIAVHQLGLDETITLTREDLDRLVGPVLEPTFEMVRDTLVAAGIADGDVDLVITAGGAARTPLVLDQLGAGGRRLVAADLSAVAGGCALVAAPAVPVITPVPAPAAADESDVEPAPPLLPEPATEPEPLPPAEPELERGPEPEPEPVPPTGPAVAADVAGAVAEPEPVPAEPVSAPTTTRREPEPAPSATRPATARPAPSAVREMIPPPAPVVEQPRPRRHAGTWFLVAAVVTVLAVVLVVLRPWQRTGSSGEVPSNVAAGASSSAPTAVPSSGTVTSTRPTASASPAVTTSSRVGSAPTTIKGRAVPGVPAIIPSGTRCDTVTLGFLGGQAPPGRQDADVTGDPADFGRTAAGMFNGVDLAIDQFNRANPDCTVRLRSLNTLNSPGVAAERAGDLADDKAVVGVVAGVSSADLKTAGPVLDAAGLPFLTPSAGDPKLASAGWAGFARVIASDVAPAAAAANYLLAKGYGKVAVVDDGSDHGRALAEVVADRLGRIMSGRVTVQQESPDYAGSAAEIDDPTPDAVYFAGRPTVAGKVLSELRGRGYAGAFLFAENDSRTRLLSTASDQVAEGALFTCPCAPPAVDPEFEAAYMAAYGAAPPAYAAEAYDAALVLLNGIADGRLTRADLVGFVAAYDRQGITKTIRFTADGDQIGNPTWILRITGGKVVREGFVS